MFLDEYVDEIAGRFGQRRPDAQADLPPAPHQFRRAEGRHRTADSKVQTLSRKGVKTQMGFHAFLLTTRSTFKVSAGHCYLDVD